MCSKAFLLTLSVFILNSFVNPVSLLTKEESEPYCKVENAVIHYEYYGLDKGAVKLFIKDYGLYVRREDNRIITSNGKEKEYRFFYLLTPESFYQADLHDSNVAVKMPRPTDKEGLVLLIHEIMVGEQAESFETEKRYKKEEDDYVCEQRCKVYYDEIGGMKYWIWNDIILKTESIDWETKEPGGKRAISVDINPKFKEDAFSLPKGIEVIGVPFP